MYWETEDGSYTFPGYLDDLMLHFVDHRGARGSLIFTDRSYTTYTGRYSGPAVNPMDKTIGMFTQQVLQPEVCYCGNFNWTGCLPV